MIIKAIPCDQKRTILTHEYFGVDTSLVWEIIKNDIPDLKEKIKQILDLEE
jgi:uncharacterized protein with HEPN domain